LTGDVGGPIAPLVHSLVEVSKFSEKTLLKLSAVIILQMPCLRTVIFHEAMGLEGL
jgi:hypothetical protein